ncbi:acyl-CoA thioester hydrolase [Sphingobium faniae]|nr:acyl-CoA thioester hydrolase [Sphingobium faniae]
MSDVNRDFARHGERLDETPPVDGIQAFPLIAFRGVVEEEWVDANHHMNSMAYAQLFWTNLRTLFRHIGVSAEYVTERRLSFFQRETHISYERELRGGDPIEIRTWLIGHDVKRLHHFHELWHVERNYRAATSEYMSLHIDLSTRSTAPFPDDIRAALDQIAQGFAGLEPPAGVSRRISLENRKTPE